MKDIRKPTKGAQPNNDHGPKPDTKPKQTPKQKKK